MEPNDHGPPRPNENENEEPGDREGFDLDDDAWVMERPPDLSLEDCIRIDKYTAIDERLRTIVAALPTPPAWHAAWLHSTRGRKLQDALDAQVGPEERLAVWQAVRDSAVLPEDAGFYLVADQLKFLTELHIGEIMEGIDRRTDALWAEHGFEEWREQARRDAEDFLAFRERCPLDWDRLYFEMLRKYGEHEIARLYRTDRTRFEERLRTGHDYFHSPPPAEVKEVPEPPAWWADFCDRVTQHDCLLTPRGGTATTHLTLEEREDYAEVTLSLAPVQLFGGPHDGEVANRRFVLDVERLRDIFDEVQACAWDPFDMDSTPYGCHVWIAGTFQGHSLLLRVLHTPDEHLEPEPLADGD